MKYAIIVVFSACFLGAAFAQKACSCDPITAYVKQRDFDSIGEYKPQSLLKESWRFSKMTAPKCKAYSAHLRAEYHLSKAQYETARKYLEKEKFILDSINCKRSSYLENNIAFGDYYLRIGEFKFAVDAYTKALSLFKKQANPNLQSKVLLALSAAQSKLGDEEKSRNYLFQAHPLVMHLPDGPGKVDNLLNLSSRYYYHFQVSSNSALLDSSYHAADFGLSLAKRISYKDAFVKGYNLMEDKAYHERNFRVALLYLDSALLFTQSNTAFNDREGIFADMSDIYLELKQYDKAYQFADSSLSYAMKMENPYKVKNALELVYNCAKLSGEYERALLVYEDLAIMRDSVKQLQSQKAYNDLEEKFHRVHKEKQEFEYKQDQKLLQQQREIGDLRNKLIAVGWVIFALLGFYMFMVFRQRSIKQRQKKLEIQQRLNKARINPEFIYQAISNLKNVQANTDFSKKVTAFSKLIKQLLEGSGDDFLTLDKELEFLKLYLDIERDQKGKSFDFQFEVDEHLDIHDVCIPTMILQPFIENTVNQGFKGLKHPGELLIKFTLLGNNELAIKIQDNGRGLKAVDSSRASGIINDRLYLLNKINKASSSYIIRERQSGGVSIEIFLPLITKAYAEKLSSEEGN
jgi:tetratricopeptide (TPR) repeat protein